MLQLPRIPELAQRDRFVRRAVKEGRVLTLADQELASVASQKVTGRTVQLFWSSSIEAKRWAEALAGDDALQIIPLPTFAADILPGIGVAKGLAGTDWVADPIEAEIDPADLLLRLKTESLSQYVVNLEAHGEVYLVAGDDGPLVEVVQRRQAEVKRLVLFTTRQDAERYMKRSGGASVMSDPVADFRGSTLRWAAERGYEIAIEPILGAGPLDLKPQALAARFSAA
ncbi:MAG: DUF2750 domain-containing protein [Hyphomicrobium sp.]|nr:DUF2750 domain-containing protein [Hyphomicrobium sp.]